MDDFGISNLAMDMSTVKLQTEMSMKVMKMANDMTEQLNSEMIEMMADMTGAGHNLDVSV